MIDDKELKSNPESSVDGLESQYSEAEMLVAAAKLEKHPGWHALESLL